MRKTIILFVAAAFLIAGSGVLQATPPARPLPLTTEQFDYVCQLETQVEHSVVLEVHASYKSEQEKQLELTRLSDDVFTVAYTGGFPALILGLLICAAPL